LSRLFFSFSPPFLIEPAQSDFCPAANEGEFDPDRRRGPSGTRTTRQKHPDRTQIGLSLYNLIKGACSENLYKLWLIARGARRLAARPTVHVSRLFD